MANPPLPLTLVDWLDDLCVRFLLNLPSSELSSVPRLCFQVEEAQWYYEDFVRPAVAGTPGAAPLPALPLRQFCLLLFQHCPLLSGFTDAQHIAAYEEFLAYKVRVPVRGAILMDESMSKVVLVRGWKKGSSWSFPRGKINKDERDLDCAIREVYEETGYDISTSGLLPENYNYEDEVGEESKIKYIDMTMREQHIRLFVLRGVPLDTVFETKTRKEISKIAWYDIKDLPGFAKHQKRNHHLHAPPQQSETETASKFYMVAPFLGPLKKWINLQRKQDVVEAKKRKTRDSLEFATGTEEDTEDQTPDHGHAVALGREEALKKLLSIGGGPSPAPMANTSAPSATDPNAHAGNLLAMLRAGAGASSSNEAQSLQRGLASNGGHVPRTPFDQINAFPPKEPETPQPQHLRQPSVGAFLQHPEGGFRGPPPPPQFPFSPQGMPHAQQRNMPLPTPNIFGQPQFPQSQGPPFQHPGMAPLPHPQQRPFPPRPNLQGPPYPSAPYPSGPQNNFPFSPPSIPQDQPRMQPTDHIRPPPFQGAPPQNVPFMAPQGPGAIGSGPSAPNASQLPPPRMNAHASRLLDAFKSGSGNSTSRANLGVPPAAQAGSAKGQSSTHQTALLDLFKKPPPAELPASQTEHELEAPVPEEPLSPTLTDVTEKPPRPKMEERRPTLNEITRTLGPLKVKSKKASAAQTAAPAELAASTETEHADLDIQQRNKEMERQLFDPYEGVMKPVTPTSKDVREDVAAVRERPTSRQLFDPLDSNTTKPVPNAKVEGQEPSSSPVRKILQRPASKQGSRSPKLNRQTLAPATATSSSPARDGAPQGGSVPGSRPSSFTILTRPGSSRGPKSPALPVTPTSEVVRNESEQMLTPKQPPMFQPQVLKRPKDGSGAVDGEKRIEESSGGTREHLLALFGKGAAASDSGGASRAQQPPVQSSGDVESGGVERQASMESSKKNTNANALLGLFSSNKSGGSTKSTTLMPSQTPSEPPPAPKLSPSARKVSPAPPPAAPAAPSAQALTPTTTSTTTQLTNPRDQHSLLLDLFQHANKPAASASGLTSTNNINSPGTPISPFMLGTPATNVPPSVGSRLASDGPSSVDESKDKEFLMGYLNGVVKGEGFRGAAWKS